MTGALIALCLVALCLVAAMYVVTMPEKAERRQPQPGEVWRQKSGGDPWAKPFTVTVLDVRDGWVRYKMIATPYSMKMSSFLTCYEPTP